MLPRKAHVVPTHLLWVCLLSQPSPYNYYLHSTDTRSGKDTDDFQTLIEPLHFKLFTIYHCQLLKIVISQIPGCRVAWVTLLFLKLLYFLLWKVPISLSFTHYPGSQGSLCSEALFRNWCHPYPRGNYHWNWNNRLSFSSPKHIIPGFI